MLLTPLPRGMRLVCLFRVPQFHSYRSGTDDKVHLKCQEGVQGGGGEGTCAFVLSSAI